MIQSYISSFLSLILTAKVLPNMLIIGAANGITFKVRPSTENSTLAKHLVLGFPGCPSKSVKG